MENTAKKTEQKKKVLKLKKLQGGDELGSFINVIYDNIFNQIHDLEKSLEITTDPLPKKYLDKEIIEVQGSGCWSRSDFLFIVDRSDE